MPTPTEIKKALISAGFELYRTRGEVVHIADRVRENLLMDSGIFVHAGRATVGFVVRAQHTDFPNETRRLLGGQGRRLSHWDGGRDSVFRRKFPAGRIEIPAPGGVAVAHSVFVEPLDAAKFKVEIGMNLPIEIRSLALDMDLERN